MRKRILFICNIDPICANNGNAQRTSVFLNAFLNNGFNVDIAYIGSAEIPLPQNLPVNTTIALWNNGHSWKKKDVSIWWKRVFVNTNATSYELKENLSTLL